MTRSEGGWGLVRSEVKEEVAAAGRRRGTEAAREEPEGSSRLLRALPPYERQGMSGAQGSNRPRSR